MKRQWLLPSILRSLPSISLALPPPRRGYHASRHFCISHLIYFCGEWVEHLIISPFSRGTPCRSVFCKSTKDIVSNPSPFEFPCTHIGEVYLFPYSSWQLQLPAKSDDAILHGKRPTLVHAAPPPGRPKARSTPRSHGGGGGGGGSDPLSVRENLGQWRHLRR